MFVSTTGLTTVFSQPGRFAEHKSTDIPCDIAYTETEEVLAPDGGDGEASIVGKERGGGEEKREGEECAPCEVEDGHCEGAGRWAEAEERHVLFLFITSFRSSSYTVEKEELSRTPLLISVHVMPGRPPHPHDAEFPFSGSDGGLGGARDSAWPRYRYVNISQLSLNFALLAVRPSSMPPPLKQTVTIDAFDLPLSCGTRMLLPVHGKSSRPQESI